MTEQPSLSEALRRYAKRSTSLIKKLPAMQETWVRSFGQEDPLEKGMATHSSILAWRIHGLYSPQGCKESDMTEQLSLSLIKNKQKNNKPKAKKR